MLNHVDIFNGVGHMFPFFPIFSNMFPHLQMSSLTRPQKEPSFFLDSCPDASLVSLVTAPLAAQVRWSSGDGSKTDGK
jgi:hypothetical protein